MPFKIPEMPLTALIYAADADLNLTLRGPADCNVAVGHRANVAVFGRLFEESMPTFHLLFPRGTDVRDEAQTGVGLSDEVEVPEGSGRWYTVGIVNDVGQGFPNEYRAVWAWKSTYQGLWPSPLPPVWEPGGMAATPRRERVRRTRPRPARPLPGGVGAV